MNGLTFIQGLKQSIYDIKINQNNHIFYFENDYNLVKKLKSFSLNELKHYKELPEELKGFSQDLISRYRFNERIKYAIIKLNEFLCSNINPPKNYLKKHLKQIINKIKTLHLLLEHMFVIILVSIELKTAAKLSTL